MFYLIEYLDSKEFSVVESEKVKIDDIHNNIGRVMHKGKWFNCKIIKFGTKEYIEKKSLKFQRYESIETSEDKRPNNKKSKFFSISNSK